MEGGEMEDRNQELEGLLLEPGLVELFGQAHDAIERLEDFTLRKKVEQSAIDLEVDLNLVAWCGYLLHPRQSVRSLLDRENLARVLLHVAVALPEL